MKLFRIETIDDSALEQEARVRDSAGIYSVYVCVHTVMVLARDPTEARQLAYDRVRESLEDDPWWWKDSEWTVCEEVDTSVAGVVSQVQGTG